MIKYKSNLSESEYASMEQAVDLAQRFSEKNTYTGRLIRYGGFAYKENQIASVVVNDRVVCRHESKEKLKEVNSHKLFVFQWQCGDPIQLKIDAKAGILWGGIETAADLTSKTPINLRLLTTETQLIPWTSSWDWGKNKYMAEGGYFIQSQIEEISGESWEAFENYITPGNAW